MTTITSLLDRKVNSDNATVAAADNDFGPFINIGGRQTFDFTLLFEETILSILPSVLLLVLIPPRILSLWRSPRKVTPNYLRTTKIVLLAIFTILEIVNVVLVSRPSAIQTRASLAATLLELAAAFGLCILSYFEHTRTVRPSSIINAYLLFTILFDAAQLRTRWLRGGDVVENRVFSSSFAIKILVLVIEAVEKRGILLPTYANNSPEATSGLYSRRLFWWLNPLFQLGFKRNLLDSDLLTTDEGLSSIPLHIHFERYWARRINYPKKHALVWVMFRVMWRPLATAIFPRICLIFLRFMQPLLINSIIQLISEPSTKEVSDRGWGLTGAVGLVYVGLALTSGAYQHKSNRVTTMVRGTLVSAIYKHTLDLSITALDESAAVTLMSSDVERICEAIQPINDVWANVIELALAVWLLEKQIGIALIGPILITTCALTGPFLLSPHMATAQKSWIEGIQIRIDTTAKMLGAMKGIKMLGLSSKLATIVHQLRMDEIARSLKMRKLFVGVITFGNMSDALTPGAAFTVYVIVAAVNGQILNVTSAYTALSLIALLVAPIRSIVFTTPPLIAAVGCFDRIESFLLSASQQDHRLLLPATQSYSSGKTITETVFSNTSEMNAIELEDMSSSRNQERPPVMIKVTNLSLAWSTDGRTVVDDVSFDVYSGKLTMVVGPIGSGKSSLLRGLLGETPSSKGSVNIHPGHVGFVDQTPWIQNTTIRQNIIGVSHFEPEWYGKVVHACSFENDLANFPKGDETIVGSAGTSVSGGQKLRIALARAVYSRRHVIMLDDVFSGLDATSEDNIFSRLLGQNGLLRRMGTAVLLATHAAHRLSYADHIIALSSSGTITEQGSFQQLMGKVDGYVSNLAARHTTEAEDRNQEETKPTINQDPAQVNATKDLHRPVGDWAVYKYYFAALGRRETASWLALIFLYAVFQRFPDLWIRFWTTAITAHGNSVNGLYLGILLAAEIIAMILLIISVLRLFAIMVPQSAIRLHDGLLRTVENAPLSFFTSTDNGQVVNRFSQDLTVIDMELPLAALLLWFNSCTSIMQAILICISAAYFAAVLPFVMAIMYVLQKFYLRTSRQMRLMDLEAKAPLYSNFLESLNGLVTIRASGWTKDMQSRNMTLLDASQRPYYLLFCIQRWLALVLDLLVAVLAVILVALIMIFRTRADPGFVGLALLNIMTFNISLSQLIATWTTIETSLGAVSRIKSFVDNTRSENRPEESADVPENWPAQGSVQISNLSAAYTSQSSPALRNINLSIPAGQKLGLCGHSGSGKSSLVSVLFHMLEITNGSITVDGVDISTIPRQVVRERLSAIPQEPVFLKGTIRQNLDPFSLDTNDSEIKRVLQTVGLWTIVANAGGLDVAMDAEDLLSHGQRQLFCLARAMLKFSTILILDEATASVDLETDQWMQKIMRDHFEGCTIIAVAHRLQTIRDFDKIVVLDNGTVVEYGEPDSLLEDENSKFKELWDS